MASVVGIPLGFAVLGTLAVLTPLGYVASALIFGRLMVHRPGTGGRIGAFFAGFGILRFGALVPGLGFVIGFFFATYGFGAVIIAAWRAGRRSFGVDELHPEYAAPPPPTYNYETEGWPGYAAAAELRRRAARRRAGAHKAGARKAGARKAPTKKLATPAKAGGTKRAKATTSRAARARKTGPRKKAAKKTKRTTRKPAKRTTKKPAKRTARRTTKKPAKRTTKKPAKRTTKTTTKKAVTKTARKPAKKTRKKTTKKAPATSTSKRRAPASGANGRASSHKRVSANNSRATKRPRPRKASTNRSGARARA
jgi:hypothetical protein